MTCSKSCGWQKLLEDMVGKSFKKMWLKKAFKICVQHKFLKGCLRHS